MIKGFSILADILGVKRYHEMGILAFGKAFDPIFENRMLLAIGGV